MSRTNVDLSRMISLKMQERYPNSIMKPEAVSTDVNMTSENRTFNT